MSGHYKEREIKIIEETYYHDNTKSVEYQLRLYKDDGDYDLLMCADTIEDLLRTVRTWEY